MSTPINQGLSRRTKTILSAVSGGLSTYAVILSGQDADDIGTDDEIAGALLSTAEAFRKVAATRGKIDRNDILRLIADSLYEQIENRETGS